MKTSFIGLIDVLFEPDLVTGQLHTWLRQVGILVLFNEVLLKVLNQIQTESFFYNIGVMIVLRARFPKMTETSVL